MMIVVAVLSSLNNNNAFFVWAQAFSSQVVFHFFQSSFCVVAFDVQCYLSSVFWFSYCLCYEEDCWIGMMPTSLHSRNLWKLRNGNSVTEYCIGCMLEVRQLCAMEVGIYVWERKSNTRTRVFFSWPLHTTTAFYSAINSSTGNYC